MLVHTMNIDQLRSTIERPPKHSKDKENIHSRMASGRHIVFSKPDWNKISGEVPLFFFTGFAYQGRHATLTGGLANFLRTDRGAVEAPL
jgi:hypothetical protein